MERSIRLRKNEEFQRVYRRGVAVYDRSFKVIGHRNGMKKNRYGISVSKKHGKAHTRNLLKRRLREILRRNAASFPVGYDFVIVPRVQTAAMPYDCMEQSLLHCMRQIHPEKKKREKKSGENERRGQKEQRA